MVIQAVQIIERCIRERRLTDFHFINYWLYVCVLNPITLGFYSLYLFFKRISRIDHFIERKFHYYNALIDYSETKAKGDGVYELVRNSILELRMDVEDAFSHELKKINKGRSFLLVVITLGLWHFILRYRLNKIWNELQYFEQDFDDQLSFIWAKMKITRYPVRFHIDYSKNRSYLLYMILCIVTFGIWIIVWDYKIHTDPERLYPEFHDVEDTILQTIRCI